MKDNELVLIDEEGNETLAEILFTFHEEEWNKDYVVFAVGEEVSAAAYQEGDGPNGNLFPIETDAEWERVEELLASFLENQEEGEEN